MPFTDVADNQQFFIQIHPDNKADIELITWNLSGPQTSMFDISGDGGLSSHNWNLINGNGYFFQYNQSSKIWRQLQVFSGDPVISATNISYIIIRLIHILIYFFIYYIYIYI